MCAHLVDGCCGRTPEIRLKMILRKDTSKLIKKKRDLPFLGLPTCSPLSDDEYVGILRRKKKGCASIFPIATFDRFTISYQRPLSAPLFQIWFSVRCNCHINSSARDLTCLITCNALQTLPF